MADKMAFDKELLKFCSNFSSMEEGLIKYTELVRNNYKDDAECKKCVIDDKKNDVEKYEFNWEAKYTQKVKMSSFQLFAQLLGYFGLTIDTKIIRFKTFHGLSKTGLIKIKMRHFLTDSLKVLAYIIMISSTLSLFISTTLLIVEPIEKTMLIQSILMIAGSLTLLVLSFLYNFVENKIRVPSELRIIAKQPFTLKNVKKIER